MQVCGCSENRRYRWKVRWYLRDPEKDQAINYPQNRACFRSGEIRILDSTGKLERTIAFDEADRKL
jgi:hypothetical protein